MYECNKRENDSQVRYVNRSFTFYSYHDSLDLQVSFTINADWNVFVFMATHVISVIIKDIRSVTVWFLFDGC